MPRCSSCTGDYRCVSSDGPYPCRYLFYGERPGQEEEAGGRPFIGKSGREFNQTYLGLAGLERDDIHISNVVQCGCANNKKPTPDLISTCSANHIPGELWMVQPDIIVPMGAVACSLFPDIWLERDHGILHHYSLFGKVYPVFPTYHPAAGMHDTNMMIPMLDDFPELRKVITSGFQSNAVINKYPNPTYTKIRSAEEVDLIFRYADPWTGVGLDMETVRDKVWCTTFSVEDGTGYMIDKDNYEAAMALSKHLNNPLAPRLSILHHGLFARDAERMAEMGVTTGRMADSAHVCRHLGNQPQKLKALAYRLLGIRMREYEDVVMPYSRASVIAWLTEAWMIANDNPTIVPKIITTSIKSKPAYREEISIIKSGKNKGQEKVKRIKTGEMEDVEVAKVTKATTKNSPLYSAISRIIKHTSKELVQDSTPYNPWNKWAEMGDPEDKENTQEEVDYWQGAKFEVERRLGAMPQAGLDQVPESEQVAYACEDARATRECYYKLVKMAHGVGRNIYVGDYDK